ncbi:MAG: hypothetical protein C0497_06405 [Gemmatimonas sp.]|nr:hypothetical protein [Gemmatimonas sp.]
MALFSIDRQYLDELRAWNHFAKELRLRNRYVVRDMAYFERLVDETLATEAVLPKDAVLFRARMLDSERTSEKSPYGRMEMGAPSAAKATSGRLNPQGISCLYLADTPNTAISEVRPFVGAVVCVATLTTLRDLRILDLSGADVRRGRSPTMRALSRTLARPVHQDDGLAYIATQFLAETLKSKGVDGLQYASALQEGGRNVALFNPRSARVDQVRVVEVRRVEYTSSDLQNFRARKPKRRRVSES